MRKVPTGIRILSKCQVRDRMFSYKVFIIIFTFVCYTSYHLCRKPISVVKSVLHRNCSMNHDGVSMPGSNNISTSCGWKPFDGKNSATLLGVLDLAFILAYASGCFVSLSVIRGPFFSGRIAERMNLRYFLSDGQILTGVFTMVFAFGYFFEVHSLPFFMIVQILAGLFQSTGWTSVVTCMGNWLGKGKRGFIMGVWNANVSVGKILGLFVAGAFVDYEWGLSFIVPGVVIFFNGVLTFLFLVPEPTDVGCETPDQIGRKCNSQSEPTDCAENEAETITVLSSTSESNEFEDVGKEIIIEKTETENLKSIYCLKNETPVSFIGALKIPFGEISLNSMGDVTITSFASTDGLTDGLTNGHGNSSILPQQLSTSEVEIPVTYSASKSAFISVIFDVGGIFGGITSGMLSDVTGKSALTCFGSLLLAGPILHIYYVYGNLNLGANIGLSFLCGFFVYGPNTLITTAVSADLGTQQALKDNTKALATVSALIDGTGSIGAAIGPLLVGVIVSSYGWSNVFYVLIASVICAMLFLLRLLIKEIKDSELLNTIKTRFTSKNHVI